MNRDFMDRNSEEYWLDFIAEYETSDNIDEYARANGLAYARRNLAAIKKYNSDNSPLAI